ncbi:dihydroorotate dehydrogenase B catalytic subunit [Paenibacillus sp. MY03]|uniref:dihydroorotate dehydrogenase n=1 Tax=Paenibacillus sp. MY03 TaxID=302980 RepID=UPI000B3C5F41|nr:dihydroorotate dehydrogenase [Paenibacillus sp. MY03]OUS68310.1 dihydroorotate dehydrogenase B catalytic subunit [Paenibacillus sp. MY03]
MSCLSSELAGVKLRNPILMASGTFGFATPVAKLYPLDKLGGVVTKGLTAKPRSGNKGTRLYETPSGLMNSVGLENPGIPRFLSSELDEMTRLDTNIIINLGGSSIQEYEEGAAMIEEACKQRKSDGKRSADLLELNISCPNVKEGGMLFGLTAGQAREVVRVVRRTTSLPLLVKLSPNAQDLVRIAEMCETEGADGVSLVNTFQAMAIDIHARKSVFRHGYAGLSGPAIKPIALRMVHQVTKAVTIPVVGMGGISSASDILEFIMAGAAAVQIGTYNFMNIMAGASLADELQTLMKQEGISSLQEVRGIV